MGRWVIKLEVKLLLSSQKLKYLSFLCLYGLWSLIFRYSSRLFTTPIEYTRGCSWQEMDTWWIKTIFWTNSFPFNRKLLWHITSTILWLTNFSHSSSLWSSSSSIVRSISSPSLKPSRIQFTIKIDTVFSSRIFLWYPLFMDTNRLDFRICPMKNGLSCISKSISKSICFLNSRTIWIIMNSRKKDCQGKKGNYCRFFARIMKVIWWRYNRRSSSK